MKLFQLKNPDVRDRLRYNILPTDTERNAIINSLTAARTRLAKIEGWRKTWISVVYGLIFTVDTNDPEEIALRQYISHYSSLLAPVRLLSVEILQIIILDPDLHGFGTIGSPPPSFVTSYKANAMELLGHAERWAHVALPSHSEFLHHLSPARNQLPLLRTIAFLSPVAMDGPLAHDLNAFENAPKLRYLSLDFMRAEPADLPPLPWHQLRQVSINSRAQCALGGKIMALAPKLHGITIDGSPWPGEAASSYQPISNPPPNTSMRKIILFGNDNQHQAVTTVLASMNTPGLKELLSVGCGAWNSPSVTSLVQRSGCRLERLVLQGTRVRAGELLVVLRAIPTLETLEIADSIPNTVNNAVVEALTLSAPQLAVLPTLMSLVLKGAYLFRTEKLLTMLESRMRPQNRSSAPMAIDITLNRELSPAELQRFSALEGHGSGRLVCFDEARTRVRKEFGDPALIDGIEQITTGGKSWQSRSDTDLTIAHLKRVTW